MQDLLKTLNQEHQAELTQMKLEWEALKLKAKKEKIHHPELAKDIDQYLETIKSTLYNFIINLADDEEEKQNFHNDIKYVFGEDI